MQEIVLLIHVIVGVLFIIFVIMQDRGVGFGGVIGGTGGGTGFYASRRGAAKVIHIITVVLCTLFLVTALVYVVLPASVPTSAPTVTTTTAPPADSGDSVLPTVDVGDGGTISIEATPVE